MPPENRRRRTQRKKGLDTSTWTEPEKKAHKEKQLLKTPVAEMDLPVRIINTLEENGVILAEQLMAQTYGSLMGMRNFGDKTLTEVRAAIKALGLEPPGWEKPPTPKKIPSPRGRGKALINWW